MPTHASVLGSPYLACRRDEACAAEWARIGSDEASKQSSTGIHPEIAMIIKRMGERRGNYYLRESMHHHTNGTTTTATATTTTRRIPPERSGRRQPQGPLRERPLQAEKAKKIEARTMKRAMEEGGWAAEQQEDAGTERTVTPESLPASSPGSSPASSHASLPVSLPPVAVCIAGQLRSFLTARVQDGYARHLHRPMEYEYFLSADEAIDLADRRLRITVVGQADAAAMHASRAAVRVEKAMQPCADGTVNDRFLLPMAVRLVACSKCLIPPFLPPSRTRLEWYAKI